jgi:hypothetical protein
MGSDSIEHATTQFIEANPTIVGTTAQPTHNMSTYIEQFSDIKAFLEKPILVGTDSWNTSSPAGTNILSFDCYSLLSNTIWANKISGFAMLKADFIITVQVNSSPFQQGKLLLHYVPCYKQFSDAYTAADTATSRFNYDLAMKLQHPHVEIDCRKTSIKFRIPYIAPTHYYPLKEGFYDWGRVFLDIFSPLKTGTGSSTAQENVAIAIWAHLENVELIAPTIPQASGKDRVKRKGGEVKETAENQGPIESGLRTVGKVSSILEGVPVLSEIASGVTWASNIAANIASVFGWSKPRELDGVQIMGQQLYRYQGTMDGPDVAIPGGIICNNRIDYIDYASYTNEDEMSLAYLYHVPFFKEEVTWNATDSLGTMLYEGEINPAVVFKNTSTITDMTFGDYVVATTSPAGYLSRLFDKWRGNIDLTIKFVKTQMHSGRLQITFIPYTGSIAVKATESNAQYALRSVVDVRDETEVTFTLPYLAFSDYLNVRTADGGSVLNSGYLQIMVLNELKGPDTVADEIGVQLFFKPGKDFELAAPGNLGSSGTAAPFLVTVGVAQSSSTDVLRGEGVEPDLPGGNLGNLVVNEDELFHSVRCIGEKVMSIKSLLLRNTPIYYMDVNPFATTSKKLVAGVPWFIQACEKGTTGPVIGAAGSIPYIGMDLYSYLAPMYAFYRGGIRWSAITKDAEVRSCITNDTNSVTVPAYFYTTNYLLNTTSFTPVTDMLDVTVYPQPVNFSDVGSKVMQHVPYYNSYPFSLTRMTTSTETGTRKSVPSTTVNFSCEDGFPEETVLMRSVCDDFQLMFFINCPLYVESWTAPPEP